MPAQAERPMLGNLPADQQTYSDPRRMIADVFVLLYLDGDHWSLSHTETDGTPIEMDASTKWMREYFLRSVEFALGTDAKPDTLFNDFGEEISGLEFGKEGTDEWTRIEVRFDGRDSLGAWSFSVMVYGEDDSGVWITGEAMKDKAAVAAAIAEARQAIGSKAG